MRASTPASAMGLGVGEGHRRLPDHRAIPLLFKRSKNRLGDGFSPGTPAGELGNKPLWAGRRGALTPGQSSTAGDARGDPWPEGRREQRSPWGSTRTPQGSTRSPRARRGRAPTPLTPPPSVRSPYGACCYKEMFIRQKIPDFLIRSYQKTPSHCSRRAVR